MATKPTTQCEECGRWVEYDEDTDGPVDHACIEDAHDDQSLSPLNFDE